MADSAVSGPSSPQLPTGPESAPSPSPVAAAVSRERRSSPSLQLTRRRSAQERINGILENARNRAEAIGATLGPDSPRMQPLLRSSSVSPPRIPEHDPGYNDHLVMRQPSPRQPPNYQTVTPTQPGHSSSAGNLRSRKSSVYSRQQSRTELHGPGNDGATEVSGAGPEARMSGEDEEKWWLRVLKNFRSVELENKGSVARDHLALERTFLAWLRTSLAFASIGIAITQLFRLNTSLSDGTPNETLRQLGKPLGVTFLAISILILFLGYRRYFESQSYVIRGKFPASRGTIILVSLIAFAVTVASLVVVIAVQSSS